MKSILSISILVGFLLLGEITTAVAHEAAAAGAGAVTNDIDDDEHTLSLVLDKPLGLLVAYNNKSHGTFVSSLLEHKQGSAHKLPPHLQELLVGSRIIAINHENTTSLSFQQVTDILTKATSPILVNFSIDEEEDDEEEEDSEIVRYAPHTQDYVAPGQIVPLKWKDTGEAIDSRASRVGLPTQLVPTIQEFAAQVHLFERIQNMLYHDECGDREGRFYHFKHEEKELLWYGQRPYKTSNWNANLHYFSPGNEYTFETVLDVLIEGGFGDVIQAIGQHFQLESLAVQGIGFLGVTHCEEGSLHKDFSSPDGSAFNFLLPLEMVQGSEPELVVAGKKRLVSSNETNTTNKEEEYEEDYEQEDEEEYELTGTKVKYTPEIGMLMGDTSWHGTRECDNRPDGARIMMNIFLVDISESNVEHIAADFIDIFPVPGITEWLWAQRGRHWRKDMCVPRDLGRAPFTVYDEFVDCATRAEHGECEILPNPTVRECPMSCKVFLSSDE